MKIQMKWIRRWSIILHRDIGFFFIGTSLIYGLSGIALNHLNDWNPSYSVAVQSIKTNVTIAKGAPKENIMQLVAAYGDGLTYKSHYYPDEQTIKVFLKGGSNLIIDTETGLGRAEYLKRRVVFYEANYLHYNPNDWWMWFSDIFAGALIFLALSSFFMVKGKKGATGRGGIYITLGFIIPILFLIIYS